MLAGLTGLGLLSAPPSESLEGRPKDVDGGEERHVEGGDDHYEFDEKVDIHILPTIRPYVRTCRIGSPAPERKRIRMSSQG